eukprot:gene1273-2459_t
MQKRFLSLFLVACVPSLALRNTLVARKNTRLNALPLPETSPRPRKFYVAPSNLLNIATASIQFALRLGSGAFVNGYNVKLDDDKPNEYSFISVFGKIPKESGITMKNRPKLPIELYEFEGCPFCRKVREAVSILDIDVVFYPCPKGGPTFRQKAIKMGGKQQFPYMVDPNTKVSMYESNDIINYLFKTYGSGSKVPASLSNTFLTTLTCSLAMLPRAARGSRFEEAKVAKQPLVLWAYEPSPFCKVVRERLCELEIPHVYKTCARGSVKRSQLLKKTGTFQVPYLEDPNTGVNMFESAEIIKYIDKTYSYKSLLE